MNFEVMDIQFDEVIKSSFLCTKVDYEYAIKKLIPLIDRLDIQRNTLPAKYYRKLEKDIINGCIMPPLTIAIVTKEDYVDHPEQFVGDNIDQAFVLDGIQRLNTLNRLRNNEFDKQRPLYVNILICNSMDKLLYRMITLNNGQKSMSARHQVEILAQNIYNFDELNIISQSEKDQKKEKLKGAFKKADVIKAYLAFISNSINIDNQKIIESKLDELITDQIIDSNLSDRDIEFSDVMSVVNDYSDNEYLYKWFALPNNLIGFAAGIQQSIALIKEDGVNVFASEVKKVEDAFSFMDVSKIKLGTARRRSIQFFVNNYRRCKEYDENQLMDKLSQEI